MGSHKCKFQLLNTFAWDHALRCLICPYFHFGVPILHGKPTMKITIVHVVRVARVVLVVCVAQVHYCSHYWKCNVCIFMKSQYRGWSCAFTKRENFALLDKSWNRVVSPQSRDAPHSRCHHEMWCHHAIGRESWDREYSPAGGPREVPKLTILNLR